MGRGPLRSPARVVPRPRCRDVAVIVQRRRSLRQGIKSATRAFRSSSIRRVTQGSGRARRQFRRPGGKTSLAWSSIYRRFIAPKNRSPCFFFFEGNWAQPQSVLIGARKPRGPGSDGRVPSYRVRVRWRASDATNHPEGEYRRRHRDVAFEAFVKQRCASAASTSGPMVRHLQGQGSSLRRPVTRCPPWISCRETGRCGGSVSYGSEQGEGYRRWCYAPILKAEKRPSFGGQPTRSSGDSTQEARASASIFPQACSPRRRGDRMRTAPVHHARWRARRMRCAGRSSKDALMRPRRIVMTIYERPTKFLWPIGRTRSSGRAKNIC